MQGPFPPLLARAYLVHVRGQVEEAREQVLSKPWVKEVRVGERNGETTWQVSISDPQVAEEQLFKLLANGPAVVTEFRRKQYELENIFMQVVEGGSEYGNQTNQLSRAT